MIGMDRATGKPLSGDAHLAQSIGDILSTPLGTRPMRRDYGSMLFELIDRPIQRGTRLLCIMAVALAIARWEPRITVTRVLFASASGDPAQFALGTAALTIEGRRTDDPDPNALIRLSIPLDLGIARS